MNKTLSEQALEDGFTALVELEKYTGHTRQCLHNFKADTYENKQGTSQTKYDCLRSGAILNKMLDMTKSKTVKREFTFFGKKYVISVRLIGGEK